MKLESFNSSFAMKHVKTLAFIGAVVGVISGMIWLVNNHIEILKYGWYVGLVIGLYAIVYDAINGDI